MTLREAEEGNEIIHFEGTIYHSFIQYRFILTSAICRSLTYLTINKS